MKNKWWPWVVTVAAMLWLLTLLIIGVNFNQARFVFWELPRYLYSDPSYPLVKIEGLTKGTVDPVIQKRVTVHHYSRHYSEYEKITANPFDIEVGTKNYHVNADNLRRIEIREVDERPTLGGTSTIYQVKINEPIKIWARAGEVSQTSNDRYFVSEVLFLTNMDADELNERFLFDRWFLGVPLAAQILLDFSFLAAAFYFTLRKARRA